MIGKQLGSFRIESLIGSGAMGEVYRATHVKTGKPAAVKVIVGPAVGKGTAADRFEREAKILQQFRHENIVRFLAVGKSQGIQYFAMEFVDGDTLDNLLAKKEVLSWQEVVDLGLQLCNALQYAHEHGVVHRDLKPSNVMVTPDGTVKLTDFGIAKDLDATALTQPNRTLGTAAYMAPEQIRGTPEVSHKTDLYALGCMLHQLLTGQTPFRGTTALVLMRAHTEEPPPRASEKNPQIPRSLDNLLIKLMAKSPADRPWDAQAVAADLTNLKEKLERGEPIRMVFGESYVAPGAKADARTELASATGKPQPFVATQSDPASDTAPKKKKKRKKKQPWTVPRIGTIALAALLVGLIAVAFVLLKPKSMEQLYTESKPLIDSENFEDWDLAAMRLTELERRFPDNPYKKELTALHDKIALYKARGRARRLQSSLGKPQNDFETSFLTSLHTAEQAVTSNLDDRAMQEWMRFALKVQEQNDPALRGWYLLAQERAEELRKGIEVRTNQVVEMLEQANAADLKGEPELAAGLRRRVLQEFGQFPFLDKWLEVARARLQTDEGADASTKSKPDTDKSDDPEPESAGF